MLFLSGSVHLLKSFTWHSGPVQHTSRVHDHGWLRSSTKRTTRQTPEGLIEQICLEPFGNFFNVDLHHTAACTALTTDPICMQEDGRRPTTTHKSRHHPHCMLCSNRNHKLLCLLAANLIQEAIQHRERSRHFLHHSPLNGRGPIRRGGFTPVRCIEFLYLLAAHVLQERLKGTHGPHHRTQLPPAGGPGKLQRARPRFPSRSVHPRDGIP